MARAGSIGLVASHSLPKLTTEPCASPMRNTPGGVAAPSIQAEISSSSLLRTRGAGGGCVEGGHRTVGDFAQPGPLLIDEGYATAATLRELRRPARGRRIQRGQPDAGHPHIPATFP